MKDEEEKREGAEEARRSRFSVVSSYRICLLFQAGQRKAQVIVIAVKEEDVLPGNTVVYYIPRASPSI